MIHFLLSLFCYARCSKIFNLHRVHRTIHNTIKMYTMHFIMSIIKGIRSRNSLMLYQVVNFEVTGWPKYKYYITTTCKFCIFCAMIVPWSTVSAFCKGVCNEKNHETRTKVMHCYKLCLGVREMQSSFCPKYKRNEKKIYFCVFRYTN